MVQNFSGNDWIYKLESLEVENQNQKIFGNDQKPSTWASGSSFYSRFKMSHPFRNFKNWFLCPSPKLKSFLSPTLCVVVFSSYLTICFSVVRTRSKSSPVTGILFEALFSPPELTDEFENMCSVASIIFFINAKLASIACFVFSSRFPSVGSISWWRLGIDLKDLTFRSI